MMIRHGLSSGSVAEQREHRDDYPGTDRGGRPAPDDQRERSGDAAACCACSLVPDGLDVGRGRVDHLYADLGIANQARERHAVVVGLANPLLGQPHGLVDALCRHAHGQQNPHHLLRVGPEPLVPIPHLTGGEPRELLDAVEHGTERGLHLVHDVLAMARAEHRVEPFLELLDVDAVHAELGLEVSLQVRIDILVDPRETEHVLQRQRRKLGRQERLVGLVGVASEGGVALLARLLPLLRCAFPRARFLVRLDRGFASPALFDFLGAQPRLDYVVAMASNAVLLRHAEPAMLVARARSERSEQTEHLYMDTRYAAGTWSDARRVIIKAEVVRLGDREPRDNPRFVVTNMRQTPQFLYEKVYCARGDIENRIKELKDLQLDRTSCCRLRANQLRVLLTAAAYVLMQELRLHAARTACARTQVMWLRDRLLKLSVHVVSSVRRLVLHLPRSTPSLDAWRKIALSLGARAG